MPRSLPLRANLEWLRKLSKERLDALLVAEPKSTLSEAQYAVAREYGFASWRRLKAHVEQARAKLDSLVPPGLVREGLNEDVSPDDAELARLFGAAESGEVQEVTDLLARRPALASAREPGGKTPLHVAAEYNDPKLAAVLVAYGADPEARYGESGHTALSWAITCNASECARALLRLGAEADLFCASGLGALDHVRDCFDEAGELIPGSSRCGSTRIGTDGTRRSCPPSTVPEQLADALYIACRNGQEEVVRYLLGKHPDLTFRAFCGATPLHWAYFGGSQAIVSMLLRAGADPVARDAALGCTPRAFGICAPAGWGLAFLVRARLADDPSLATLMDGRTGPLHEAARAGKDEVVRLLLDQGAGPASRNGEGKTPLDLAEGNGHGAVAAILRDAVAASPS